CQRDSARECALPWPRTQSSCPGRGRDFLRKWDALANVVAAGLASLPTMLAVVATSELGAGLGRGTVTRRRRVKGRLLAGDEDHRVLQGVPLVDEADESLLGGRTLRDDFGVAEPLRGIDIAPAGPVDRGRIDLA